MPVPFPFPLRSLRVRLAVVFTLLVAVLLTAADLGLIGYARYVEARQTDHALEKSLEIVRSALASESEEVREGRDAEDKGRRRPSEVAVYVSVPVNALRETQPLLAEDGVAAFITSDTGIWPGATHRWGDEWRVRTRRVLPDPRRSREAFIIHVGMSGQKAQAALRAQARLLGTLTFFMVLVTAAGSFVLVGRTLRPIDLLAQQARHQAEQPPFPASYPHLTPPSPDAEVVRLVTTLNHLLRTLAESAHTQSRFYAAASHELRTPLHVLSGRVELALSRSRSREEYQAALVEVQEQAHHLVALVQSLLLLNRLHGAAAGAAAAPLPVRDACDLAGVLRARLCEGEPQRAERGLTVVETGLEAPAFVAAASEAHADILVRNLLDNAARYAPPGACIRVSLCSEGEHSPRLDIVNPSPLPSPEDAAHLGEPFHRLGMAAQSGERGGSGLGLSICRALADLNGWQLSLYADAESFHVVVVFPAFGKAAP